METEMGRRKEFASPMAGKIQRILAEYIKLLFKDTREVNVNKKYETTWSNG